MSAKETPGSTSWHVSIVQVAFRNADDILRCLQTLKAQNYRDFRICIVENGPVEAYRQLCTLLEASGLARPGQDSSASHWRGTIFDDARPLDILSAPTNPGYAGGINHVLAHCPVADALWILNPDTEVEPHALEALVDHARRGGYGIVGGRLVNPVTGRVQLYGGRWRKLIARGYNIGLGAPESAVPVTGAVEAEMSYVNGACMLVSRAYLDMVGPMRDDYFLYCEEVDWCLRRGAFRLGYAHDALIYHAHGSTIGSSTSRRDRSRLSVYLDERNRLLLTRRIYPGLFPLIALICMVLTLQYARHGAFRNMIHALHGWWAGIRGETGKPAWLR